MARQAGLVLQLCQEEDTAPSLFTLGVDRCVTVIIVELCGSGLFHFGGTRARAGACLAVEYTTQNGLECHLPYYADVVKKERVDNFRISESPVNVSKFVRANNIGKKK